MHPKLNEIHGREFTFIAILLRRGSRNMAQQYIGERTYFMKESKVFTKESPLVIFAVLLDPCMLFV